MWPKSSESMETQIMEKPSSLIRQVSEERARLVELVESLSAEQASHKPTPLNPIVFQFQVP